MNDAAGFARKSRIVIYWNANLTRLLRRVTFKNLLHKYTYIFMFIKKKKKYLWIFVGLRYKAGQKYEINLQNNNNNKKYGKRRLSTNAEKNCDKNYIPPIVQVEG